MLISVMVSFFISMVCIFISIFFSETLYTKVKQKTLEQSVQMTLNDSYGFFPKALIIMAFVVPIIFYQSYDFVLTVFFFVLAITAYTDLSTRWIPDICIYTLLAVSVYSLSMKDIVPALFGTVFFVLPALLLNLYGYIKNKEIWIASGDFYIFTSVGLMAKSEFTAALMLVTLFVALLLLRSRKNIPLITVLYFTFSGHQLWLLNG